MTPSTHAAHTRYGDASSRHAVDAVVAGNVVPIGIPALFIADQLSRGRPPEHVLSGKRGLIGEYAGAEGYAYRWGQIIELRLGRYVLWRIVPVAMWDQLTERRTRPQLLIEDWVTLVQPGIRTALQSRLPPTVLLAGCQGATRRCPHALFALLLADPHAAAATRHWLTTRFLTELLPPLLHGVERRVADLLRNVAG
jgi:hypothetical protein